MALNLAEMEGLLRGEGVVGGKLLGRMLRFEVRCPSTPDQRERSFLHFSRRGGRGPHLGVKFVAGVDAPRDVWGLRKKCD